MITVTPGCVASFTEFSINDVITVTPGCVASFTEFSINDVMIVTPGVWLHSLNLVSMM